MATALGGIPVHDIRKMKVVGVTVVVLVEMEGKAAVPVVAGVMVGIMIARGVALGRGAVVVAVVRGVATTHDLEVQTLWVSAIGYDVGVLLSTE